MGGHCLGVEVKRSKAEESGKGREYFATGVAFEDGVREEGARGCGGEYCLTVVVGVLLFTAGLSW